jgi:hypothetical protein
MKKVFKYMQFTCLILFSLSITFAGGTPNQQWFVQQTRTRAQGDYVSANSGGGQYITANKYYSFFIEVPPGTSNLVVEIYDPNIYEATSGDIGERRNGNDWDTTTTYTLISPNGTVDATLTGDNNPANNQTWVPLANIANPTNGHWEVRVQVSSGDDVNIYGIRAHDGDPTSGGRELNVYAESYVSVGHTGNGLPNPKQHTFYPYVIRGCGLREMDFDFDIGLYPGSQITFASPDGSFNTTLPSNSLSGSAQANGTGNDGWAFNLVTSNNFSSLYGLWTQTITIAGDNQGICLVTSDAHPASAPTTQPENDSFRLYLPTDAGTKPVKPQVTQTITHISGPNPPAVNLDSFYDLTFTIQNPTPYPIQFSTTNNFSSFVPGTTSNAQVTYQGNITTTQGNIISTPAINGSGSVIWNPGTVPANTNASVKYRVKVRPTNCPSAIDLTGNGNNATNFTFVDETGNTSQSRATLQIGGLCPLKLNTCVVPSAAAVTVSGRVIGPNGRGLPGTLVSMTDGSGNVRMATTNAFGFYRFTDVSAGEVYIFQVSSKRYEFQPVTMYVSEDTTLNFVPEGFSIIKRY